MLNWRWSQKTACSGALVGMEEVCQGNKIPCTEESPCTLAALANPPLLCTTLPADPQKIALCIALSEWKPIISGRRLSPS